MKKVSKLMMMAVLALGIGFTACNNEDLPKVEDLKGSTYAAISVKAATKGGTRALPGDHNPKDDWEGIDDIKTVTVFLVNETLGTVDHTKFTRADFNFANKVLEPSLAILATPGEDVKAYVILNGVDAIMDPLKGLGADAFKTKYAEAVEQIASVVAKNDGTNDIIMMTNTIEPTAVTILPGVTHQEALDGANRIDVEVERVVSRAIVTVKTGTHTINVLNTVGTAVSTATVVDVSYVVGQSNLKFFLTKKTDWSTPEDAYSYVPSVVGKFNPNKYFDNSGLSKSATVLTADDVNDYVAAAIAEKTDSKFVLPVTHEDGKYEKGNTTYFEVTAIFTPNLVDDAAYTAGSDVFLGLNDGKFYSTRALAEADGQKAVHYKGDGTTGAIMKYVLWLNPDVVPGTGGATKAAESPTVRNQVYHAHITGFKQLGVPNNPLNPTDPNNPQPYDPDHEDYDEDDPLKPMDPDDPDWDHNIPGNENPDNPIDPKDPLETEDTYLSVQITVLDWGVHSYEIDLGNDY